MTDSFSAVPSDEVDEVFLRSVERFRVSSDRLVSVARMVAERVGGEGEFGHPPMPPTTP